MVMRVELLHRLVGAAQGGGVYFIERHVAVGGKKLRGLAPAGVVQARIDAAALHNAAHVEIGLAVAQQENGPGPHVACSFA
jgi:hypothetical protein